MFVKLSRFSPSQTDNGFSACREGEPPGLTAAEWAFINQADSSNSSDESGRSVDIGERSEITPASRR